MKLFYRSAFIALLVILSGCQLQQPKITEAEKNVVKKEVKEKFNQLVNALNQKNADEWAENYSKDEFISAIGGTEYFGNRGAWVDLITKYFSMRERQKVEPVEVRVTALAPNLALMTSEEKSEMELKDAKSIKSKHVFTMIWKKEQGGWKILHSHESWSDE